jgi:uncharacterized delta-60 repeat protein
MAGGSRDVPRRSPPRWATGAVGRASLLTVTAAICVSAVPSQAAAAGVDAVAPGREVLAVDNVNVPESGTVCNGSCSGGDPERVRYRLTTGTALPNGGAVLAGPDREYGIALASVRRDGSLNRGFGRGGIARVRLSIRLDLDRDGGPRVVRLLRLPDGRLLLVTEASPGLQLTRLNPDGAVDRSFGVAGTLRRQDGFCSQAECSPVAALPDGRLVITPTTESFSAPTAGTSWVVRRLTADGEPDTTFGADGSSTLGTGIVGSSITAFPDGSLAAVGRTADGSAQIRRLTPSGEVDPAFNGGTALALPSGFRWGNALTRADGTVDLLGYGAAGGTRVLRLTRSGSYDPGFGDGGSVDLPESGLAARLYAVSDGGVVVTGSNTLGLTAAAPVRLIATRISAAGAITRRRSTPVPLAGGRTPSAELRQDSFRPGDPVMRTDGSLLVPGSVSVVEELYELYGLELETVRGALVSLTSDLRLDVNGFGGQRAAARLSVARPGRLAPDPRFEDRQALLMRVHTGGPGLARVTVRSGGRVLVKSVIPVFSSGGQTLRVGLSASVAHTLGKARAARLTTTVSFRDLVGHQVTRRIRGILR